MTDFKVLAISQNETGAAKRFATSLHETGFAILRDHPITDDEIEGMYGAWSDFFATDERFDFKPQPGSQGGYFGFKSENAKDSAHKDLKEFFHVYQEGPIPETVEEKTRAFHEKLLDIGKTLLSWLDSETPDDVKKTLSEPFADMVENSQDNLLRILHYPPLDDGVEPGETRAAAHEDINLITLLVSGSEPGLQAQDQSGAWHDVPCQTGFITVNAGDMLAKASGGYYPSTPHRVINPPKQENRSRYSMPLFVHPRPEVKLTTDLTAGMYLDERLKEIGLK